MATGTKWVVARPVAQFTAIGLAAVVVDSSLLRVKIWSESGIIVYSNDHRLEGAQ